MLALPWWIEQEDHPHTMFHCEISITNERRPFKMKSTTLGNGGKGSSLFTPILEFPITQMVKNLPAMQETWVRSLGQEDPLEKGKATHSSILAWRIPWTEEPGGLQSVGSQRFRHDWTTNTAILLITTTKTRARFLTVSKMYISQTCFSSVFNEANQKHRDSHSL